jgi:hypothetical protein
VLAALCCRPLVASAAACDQLHLFSLHTAEKTAWDSHDYTTLLALDVEESAYADSCGHKEGGSARALDLQAAATHYSDAAYMELGRRRFDSAKQHFLRSNAIIAELLKSHTAPQPEMLKQKKIFNDDGIRRAEKNIWKSSLASRSEPID